MTSNDMMPEALSRLDLTGVSIALLSHEKEDSIPHARYLIRRLRRRAPAIKIIAGFWSMTSDQVVQRKVMEETRADIVTVSLVDALDQVTSIVAAASAEAPSDNGIQN